MTSSRVSTYLLFIASLLSGSNAFIWRFRVLGATKHCHSVLQFVTRCPAPAPVTISGWLFLSTLHPITLSELHESRSECQNLYQLKSNRFLNGILASLQREEDQAGQMGFLFFVMLWQVRVGGVMQEVNLSEPHHHLLDFPGPLHFMCNESQPSFWRDTIDLHQSHACTSQQRDIILFYNFHKQRSMSVQRWMSQMHWIYLDVTFTHLVVIGLNAVWVRKTEDIKLSSATIKERSTVNQACTSAMVWWHRHHCKMQELATEQFCSTRLYLAQPTIANV